MASFLQKFDRYNVISKSLTKSKNKYPLSLQEYTAVISKKGLEYDNDKWNDNDLEELIKLAYKRFKTKEMK